MLGVQNIGAVSVVQARSSLVGECLAQCRQAVDDSLDNRRLFLVLDLTECPLVNSSGLEFIVDSQQRCLSRGGKLVVAGAQDLCREVLSITGVDERVAVFTCMRTALADFAK